MYRSGRLIHGLTTQWFVSRTCSDFLATSLSSRSHSYLLEGIEGTPYLVRREVHGKTNCFTG